MKRIREKEPRFYREIALVTETRLCWTRMVVEMQR